MELPEVDKDHLIWALNDYSGMSDYYLDLETGNIVSTFFGEIPAEWEIEEKDLESGRYWHIDSIPSWESYNFMTEFIETVKDAELKRRLYIAVDGRGAFRMFRATLQE